MVGVIGKQGVGKMSLLAGTRTGSGKVSTCDGSMSLRAVQWNLSIADTILTDENVLISFFI